MPSSRPTVTVRVHEALYTRMTEVSEAMGITPTELARKAIEIYVGSVEEIGPRGYERPAGDYDDVVPDVPAPKPVIEPMKTQVRAAQKSPISDGDEMRRVEITQGVARCLCPDGAMPDEYGQCKKCGRMA